MRSEGRISKAKRVNPGLGVSYAEIDCDFTGDGPGPAASEELCLSQEQRGSCISVGALEEVAERGPLCGLAAHG